MPLALYDLLTRTSLDAFEETALESKPGYRVPLGESDFDEGVGPGADRAIAARLKEQMKADSLRPLNEGLEEDERPAGLHPETSAKSTVVAEDQPDFDEETVEAAREHLQKNVSDDWLTYLHWLITFSLRYKKGSKPCLIICAQNTSIASGAVRTITTWLTWRPAALGRKKMTTETIYI